MTDFSLIETMLFDPAGGVPRLRLHLARLGNSTRKLAIPGFGAAKDALLQKLETLSEQSRVRLELFADGRCEITSAPFQPLPDSTVWRVRIATDAALKSTEPLLRHKTSQRHVYDAARAEYPRKDCEEVLLLNDRGEISEGTITNIFVEAEDGRLLTPPLSSGCLAGVLRASLICQKRARVCRILPKDLETRPFFVGNSLRGLIRSKLIIDG